MIFIVFYVNTNWNSKLDPLPLTSKGMHISPPSRGGYYMIIKNNTIVVIKIYFKAVRKILRGYQKNLQSDYQKLFLSGHQNCPEVVTKNDPKWSPKVPQNGH